MNSATDSYLRKALAEVLAAEETLSRIGYDDRKEDSLDDMRDELRTLASHLAQIWIARYAPHGPAIGGQGQHATQATAK